jgi:hypothetical protein
MLKVLLSFSLFGLGTKGKINVLDTTIPKHESA